MGAAAADRLQQAGGGDGEGSRWIRLVGADPPPPLATRGRRRAAASDRLPGGALRAVALDPPPRLLT